MAITEAIRVPTRMRSADSILITSGVCLSESQLSHIKFLEEKGIFGMLARTFPGEALGFYNPQSPSSSALYMRLRLIGQPGIVIRYDSFPRPIQETPNKLNGSRPALWLPASDGYRLIKTSPQKPMSSNDNPAYKLMVFGEKANGNTRFSHPLTIDLKSAKLTDYRLLVKHIGNLRDYIRSQNVKII